MMVTGSLSHRSPSVAAAVFSTLMKVITSRMPELNRNDFSCLCQIWHTTAYIRNPVKAKQQVHFAFQQALRWWLCPAFFETAIHTFGFMEESAAAGSALWNIAKVSTAYYSVRLKAGLAYWLWPFWRSCAR